MGSDAAEMRPASAVLDKHQNVRPVQQHGIHVRKLTARIPAAWAARNCFQVGPDPRGAGSMPAHAGSPTPWTAPRRGRASSARRGSGRYPHSGFSFASRMTRRAMLAAVGGRPGLRRLLVSYFFAASLRCQASNVGGVTGKISVQRLRGTSRASAANHTRSAARTAPGQSGGAAPRSRAGAPATQWPSPGRGGTSAQPRRGRGTSAGRRSLAAPDQPNITATGC